MGFFDIFRRKEEIIEVENLSFFELGVWMEKKVAGCEERHKVFLGIMKDKIAGLVLELTEGLHVLNEVSLDGKNERDRIKSIVKENHNNYMIHLERLISKLSDIHDDKNIVEEINSIFSDFQRRSFKNYEKATFLIGKEMAAIKEIIGVFFKDVKVIIDSNKELMTELKDIEEIKSCIDNYNEFKNKMGEGKNILEGSELGVVRLKDLKEKKKVEIDELKSSKEFIDVMKRMEDLEEKKRELGRSVYDLSRVIDFKALANHYHSFPKDMAVIKKYKDDFRWAFERSKGVDIVSLLKGADLYDEKISKGILSIDELGRDVLGVKIEDVGLVSLEKEFRDLESEAEKVNEEIGNGKERIRRVEENLDDSKEKLRVVLLRVGVELE